MKLNNILACLTLSLIMMACATEFLDDQDNLHGDVKRIRIAGEISQVYSTRVNDSGFCDGDAIGIYVVDYEANNPGILKNKGNRGDNVRHIFEESRQRWNSIYDLYWKDDHTRIDIYSYYPFGSPDDVNQYSFRVAQDQNQAASTGTMGGYEASDFLWGKAEGVEPTSNTIRLSMRHIMSSARVTLCEGEGFEKNEWNETKKQILITNTCRNAKIDLNSGIVNSTGEITSGSIIPAVKGNEWRAIIVPQTIEAGTVLFSITIGGIPYTFAKNEDFIYLAGKLNNFTIRVDKKNENGKYTLTLTSESITAWENDLFSHDAYPREYTVIESTPGDLKKSIADAGNDFRILRNLKITGSIDSRDFYFMRDEMESLQALNLKEVTIKGYGIEPIYGCKNLDDQIPASAFYDNAIGGKASLTNIILPDRLKSIGSHAFCGCRNLSGSLIIPEGVTDIQYASFSFCRALNGSLSLPSTLKYIGVTQNERGELIKDIFTYDGVFRGCGFTCEILLPDNLELITSYSFAECKGLFGELRLPDKLTKLGAGAFLQCSNIKGSLEIPEGVHQIEEETFCECGFDGSLILHDGIGSIGANAFADCSFKGELSLPKNLSVINEGVFCGCDFSDELKLPKTLISIGDRAFARNWRLRGNLEFAEGLITIGAGAFAHCRSLEGLIFPESLENIRYEASYGEEGGAFEGCYGIGSIVSKSELPPIIQDGAFHGISKDNFILEVPEASIIQYQTAAGWNEFRHIAAHHELVCRPSTASALQTKSTQTLVINAEGKWEIESIPDWCEVVPSSGYGKSEISLTIKKFDTNTDKREGDVVFRLSGKDYTHKCHVSQYGYEYEENQFIAIQKASKGHRGGINIVIMGDGYTAEDIASGKYLCDIKEEIEYFFGVEPYTSYRDYFNVYTAFPVSTEPGVGSLNTIRINKFATTYTGSTGMKCDYDAVFDYVASAPMLNGINLNESLIIIVPNSTDYGGCCQMWATGAAIAFCPKSDYGYPFDSRGVIQHEAGGHGFGKLGDEYIYHNAFIDFCDCKCCGHDDAIQLGKSWGWYDNLELTGKMHEVGWSHLIFDSRYSDIVDIYEGGFMHTRGVFRSEQNSCMNNNIPYFSTISRESIVKRIKRYAGETFSYEDFVANDKRTASAITRSFSTSEPGIKSIRHHNPEIHMEDPMKRNTSRNKSKQKLKRY